jgi:Fe(3+) dicitrate transport protein
MKPLFYFIIALSSFIFSFSDAQAQANRETYASVPKGAIKGKVTDNAGLAVVGVNVWLKGTSRGTSTDAEGYFEIRNVREGKHTVVVSAVNIKNIEQSVYVQVGESVVLNFSIAESVRELTEIEIVAKKASEVTPMKETEEMGIFAGKKTEVINLDKLDANLTTNNVRQVFAKTAGISVWENDGSGLQINVAARGLSPNRSWEFNVRQNGYDVSSDVFGYPEAYYNPPLEAVENIKIVRGAASLQYGAQFGGLLNYVLKKGNTQKPFTFETQQTVGSYGLFGTYNAIGGTKGKWNYYAYYQHRSMTTSAPLPLPMGK